jgi:hypothetical protein
MNHKTTAQQSPALRDLRHAPRQTTPGRSQPDGWALRVRVFEMFLNFGSFPFRELVLSSRRYRLLHLSSAKKNSCDPVESIEKEICRSRLCSCSRFFGCLRQLFSSPGNTSPPPSAFSSCRGFTISSLSINTTNRCSSQVQPFASGLHLFAPISSEHPCA